MAQFDVNIFANDEYCNFVSVNDFNDNELTFCQSFGLLHINIWSLKKHFTDLQTFLHSLNGCFFSLIVISETWLSSDFDNMFHLDGNLFHSLCRGSNFGGIRLYYKKELHVELN